MRFVALLCFISLIAPAGAMVEEKATTTAQTIFDEVTFIVTTLASGMPANERQAVKLQLTVKSPTGKVYASEVVDLLDGRLSCACGRPLKGDYEMTLEVISAAYPIHHLIIWCGVGYGTDLDIQILDGHPLARRGDRLVTTVTR